MAMNSSALAAALLARFKTAWRDDEPANQAQDEDYFLTTLATAIAEEVVSHIQANAKCSGTDSHGDTHDLVGIV